ncbi:hypothetical protein FGO68_gene7579 [Halteria grandinella]|uniref:Uncharacterized protein n=1 Tax=Halteria grandinella TaxID=5974 RepID=A0A8J8NWE5_HALGN|nr:hypothetical protein FGO68_gene7579 [Halteria grandinella]
MRFLWSNILQILQLYLALQVLKIDLLSFCTIRSSFIKTALQLKTLIIERDKTIEGEEREELRMICSEGIDTALSLNEKLESLVVHEPSILPMNFLMNNKHPTLKLLEVDIFEWETLKNLSLELMAKEQSDDFEVKIQDYSIGSLSYQTFGGSYTPQLHHYYREMFETACPGKRLEMNIQKEDK